MPAKRLFRTMAATVCAAIVVSCSGGNGIPDGSKIIFIGNSMLFYGGIVQNGNQCHPDSGMMYRSLCVDGIDAEVYDCTYGGHHLKDFTEKGCVWSERHGDPEGPQKPSGGCAGCGTDLLDSLDLASFDYVFISEAGNNYESFHDDAVAVFRRFRSVNPKVRCFYVNHIYSVYKDHQNVLSSLRRLHDEDSVTIVNCGQLAYDIYTGAVKVPGGHIEYEDRYTFTNHTDKDTFHPNPLMGWIMTQMCRYALTGKAPLDASVAKECNYAGGSVSFGDYYEKFYTHPAAVPFTEVMDDRSEMCGIAAILPKYLDIW